MRTKPTSSRPVIVCKIQHVWRGMFMAYWDDRLNYPNQLSDLFRKIDGVWTSGEAHPSGCRSHYFRPAPPEVAAALSLSSHD